mmetsp:Transcript_28624/g.52087  ORF Transcript_28624/g.52087 Transcript_28624/m.52087 type:complete len:315 (+) Transcript_28624:1114-2058(+)
MVICHELASYCYHHWVHEHAHAIAIELACLAIVCFVLATGPDIIDVIEVALQTFELALPSILSAIHSAHLTLLAQDLAVRPDTSIVRHPSLPAVWASEMSYGYTPVLTSEKVSILRAEAYRARVRAQLASLTTCTKGFPVADPQGRLPASLLKLCQLPLKPGAAIRSAPSHVSELLQPSGIILHQFLPHQLGARSNVSHDMVVVTTHCLSQDGDVQTWLGIDVNCPLALVHIGLDLSCVAESLEELLLEGCMDLNALVWLRQLLADFLQAICHARVHLLCVVWQYVLHFLQLLCCSPAMSGRSVPTADIQLPSL